MKGSRSPGFPAAPVVPAFPVEELLHVAVAHQADAVLITEADRVDPGGRRIVYVNPAFTVLTGFSAGEAIGRTPDLTIGEKSDREAIRKIQVGIESKSGVRQELLKYRKDGSTFWAELDIAPVIEADGRCHFFVCVMRDISDKMRDRELLERQARELEQASAKKSQFLASVSHELRTPLNAIVSYSSVLLEGVYGALTEPQSKAMQRLDSNARHLLALINEVLDLSRIESGYMPVQVARFSLAQVVTELLADLTPIIERSGLDVTSAIPAELPPLESDRQKVKQILLNLVNNAIKFTPEGSVRILVAQSAGTTFITVADSGVGISADQHARVFDPFWQVEGPPTGGSGLGLAICRRLATLLGGKITLESAPGQGAAFTLHLPQPAGP
jgi:PAS domain S-box-containing protein